MGALERGLTLRSSGAPAAGHAWPSFHSGPSASCRCRPLSSNVRRRNSLLLPGVHYRLKVGQAMEIVTPLGVLAALFGLAVLGALVALFVLVARLLSIATALLRETHLLRTNREELVEIQELLREQLKGMESSQSLQEKSLFRLHKIAIYYARSLRTESDARDEDEYDDLVKIECDPDSLYWDKKREEAARSES